MLFEHAQQPHHGTITLIGFTTGSGFRSNRIQTIPGIEFSCGNWIMRSTCISINMVFMLKRHPYNIYAPAG